jgi:hypothetical protein
MGNEFLMALYPGLCWSGAMERWTLHVPHLAGVNDAPHDAPVFAGGIGGNLRGFLAGFVRPTMAVFDDIETADSARSPSEREAVWRSVTEEAAGIAPKDVGLYSIMLCNALAIGDAGQMAERDPGGAMDLTEVEIDKARQEVIKDREAALAKKLAEMRHRKRDLVDPLQYAVSIGSTALVDYVPALAGEVQPPTQTQIDALAKSGIFPSDIQSSGQADAILSELAARKGNGLAAPRQIRILERYGVKGVGQMRAEHAQKLIGRIAANGWRRPVTM